MQEIDGYIMQASDKGYSAVISLGSKGLSYATNVVLNTAIKVSFTQIYCFYNNQKARSRSLGTLLDFVSTKDKKQKPH